MAEQRVMDRRLKELILYVAARCDSEKYFGAVKLNKILYFSDFEAYAKLGEPITGVEYRKYELGPAPACMERIKKELNEKREAYEYRNPLGADSVEKRLLPMRKPNLDLFSKEQLEIVNGVIDRLRGWSGIRLSRLSHRLPGWKYAEYGKEIPYHTVFMARADEGLLSDKGRAWIEKAAERLAAKRQA
jgi:hypothetical protein